MTADLIPLQLPQIVVAPVRFQESTDEERALFDSALATLGESGLEITRVERNAAGALVFVFDRPRPKRFEYKVSSWNGLDSLAAEGWRLAHTITDYRGTEFIFEREVTR